MTRYKETCQLITRTFVPNEEGVQEEKDVRRKVYCNSYSVATQAWSTARMANYNADDAIQLRTSDYRGEDELEYRGKGYMVLQRMEQGDFTRLLLQRRKADGVYDDGK